MVIEGALTSLVLQNAAIVAAIGNRFHWKYLPNDVSYPCVRATIITNPQERTHSGTYGGRETVQLDIYDEQEARCNTTADAIAAWLDNYNGAIGASHGGLIQVKTDVDTWETEAKLYKRLMEVEILYFKNV